MQNHTTSDGLPATGFVRLPQILKVIPVSKTTWFEGVRRGRYPRGVMLSPNTRAWAVDDIRKLIDDLAGRDNEQPHA